MLTEDESTLQPESTFTVISYVFDTGASTTLDGETISTSLIDSSPSNLKILGFHGSQKIKALQSGKLLGYPVGSNMTEPFKIMTNTVPGINQPLLSFTDFYENQGYGCIFESPPAFSGLFRREGDGTMIDKVPLYYNRDSKQWKLDIVIHSEFDRAREFGKSIEAELALNNCYSYALADTISIDNKASTICMVLLAMNTDVRIADGSEDSIFLISRESMPEFCLNVQCLKNESRFFDISDDELANLLTVTLSQCDALRHQIVDQYAENFASDSPITTMIKAFQSQQSTLMEAGPDIEPEPQPSTLSLHESGEDNELQQLLLSDKHPDDVSPWSLKHALFKNMTKKQLHDHSGHWGFMPGCIHCMQVQKSMT
eukprot:SAG11_NODE_4982_length_1703_cov_123.010599_1_plen_371_part_00